VAVAEGVVVEDGLGSKADIRVRRTDRDGHEHVQRFGVYDTVRYLTGRTLAVAYDPADPAVRGFPADPEETVAEDDLEVPILLAGTGVLVVMLVWAVRALLFRHAAGRAGMGADLRDQVIRPAGALPPTVRAWWGRAVLFLLTGAVLGTVAGFRDRPGQSAR
jgi:hypothetical protein